MRFTQIDRIVSLKNGESVKAVKCLSLSEDYLADHFPRFPVMPGVLMLEAIYQASMFLVRSTDDFQHSMVVLKETRNLKFQGFVQPGDQLVVSAEYHAAKNNTVRLKVVGEIEGRVAVSGVVVLEKFNLAARGMASGATDDYINWKFKQRFKLLFNQLTAGSESIEPSQPAVDAE